MNTTLIGEWEQVSGDMTASEYGATFAQLDTIGDKVYGVNVVEVINMVNACGSDWNVKKEGGAYITEESYCDVDSIDWHKAREILDSYGSWPEHCEDTALPEDIMTRVQWCEKHAQELQQLARWQRRVMTKAEIEAAGTAQQEAHTMRQWFALPRTRRAEMMHSYGGYSNGQSMTFSSLREALEHHSIPRSALWNASEYDNVPDDCKLDTDDIKLYNVEGIARLSGNDAEDNTGCTWLQQFWGEIEDSAIDNYYMGDDATEEAAIQGAWRECLEKCCICHKRIDGDAWANLDMNGELACDSHFTIVTRAE